MPEIRVNGVSLYYEEHGVGEPIVCIHGSGSSASIWADAAAELASHGRTIVYDRRGCSRSERPEPYVTSVRQHSDDAASLIDALGARPAIVIGRSYGGDVALDLAVRYPERVRALALLEPAEALTQTGAQWLSELETKVFSAAALDPGTVGGALLRAVLGDGAWDALPAPVREIFTANGPAIVAELRGGYLDVGVEELHAVLQPTLLVAGRESPPAFTEAAKLMAAAMPSSTVEWVEGGHLINPAHPAVLRFVDDVLARTQEPSTA